MENVTDLEKLAKQAETEDKPAGDVTGAPAGQPAGEHLPADVEQLRQQKARERALQLVGVLEWVLKKKDERIEFPDSAYQEAGARLAPLMLKHGVDEFGLPEWLLPYKEEISALVFVSGLGYTIGAQMLALRAADRAAAQELAKAAGEQVPVNNRQASAMDFARDD